VSDTSAPTVPEPSSATGASSTTVGITWDASSDNVGVTGYQIYRDGVKIATVTGTSWTDTGLTSGTAYVYKMKAVDAAGNISASSTTTPARPCRPTASRPRRRTSLRASSPTAR
jgi:chitodextrinase